MRSFVRLVLLTFVLALVAGLPASAARAPSFTAPVRLGFQHGDDWEPAIAADRSGHVYAAWSHYVGYAGVDTGDPDPSCPTCASPHTVLQVSSDGGSTWSSPRALWPSTQRQDDPQIVVDAADGKTVYAAFMQNNKSSQYVARSDDFGQTWQAVLVEPIQRGTDKDILAARDGHVYLVYHTQQKIFASVSHDGGKTLVDAQPRRHDELGARRLPSERWRDRLEGQRLLRLERHQQPRPGEGDEEPLRHALDRRRSDVDDLARRRIAAEFPVRVPRLGLLGLADGARHRCEGPDLRALGRGPLELRNPAPVLRPLCRPRRQLEPGGRRLACPHRIEPSVPGASPRAATATCASPGWTIGTASTPAARTRTRAGTSTTARRRTAGRRGRLRRSSRSTSPAISYKYATPKDGFAEPYGDYFELDIDSAGQTQAIWGEGPSYVGPGNVWYARGS